MLAGIVQESAVEGEYMHTCSTADKLAETRSCTGVCRVEGEYMHNWDTAGTLYKSHEAQLTNKPVPPLEEMLTGIAYESAVVEGNCIAHMECCRHAVQV